MFNLFKVHIINDEEGYNGFITLLFTSLIMVIFKVIFFLNIGLPDVKNGIDSLKDDLKSTLDTKLLGSPDYCSFLRNTTRTKHSNEIYNKYCNNNFDDEIYKIKKNSKIPTNTNDIFGQISNIEDILGSITNLSGGVITSSLYDYYRKHPELIQSNNVIKNLLKDKFNTEVRRNAYELVFYIFSILSVIVITYSATRIEEDFLLKIL